MSLWGIATCCMAKVDSFGQLVACRVIVGLLEAGFAPGILLIISSWYRPNEQSKRFAIYISAAVLSGAFGGVLAGAITKGMEGVAGLRGWRWLFVSSFEVFLVAYAETLQIIEGAATVLWAIVSYFILLDFPSNTKRLSDRERALAISRLQAANVHGEAECEEHLTSIQAMKQACSSWRVWLFVVGYMVIVGSSTLSYFYPTLVQGLGYNSTMAQVSIR